MEEERGGELSNLSWVTFKKRSSKKRGNTIGEDPPASGE